MKFNISFSVFCLLTVSPVLSEQDALSVDEQKLTTELPYQEYFGSSKKPDLIFNEELENEVDQIKSAFHKKQIQVLQNMKTEFQRSYKDYYGRIGQAECRKDSVLKMNAIRDATMLQFDKCSGLLMDETVESDFIPEIIKYNSILINDIRSEEKETLLICDYLHVSTEPCDPVSYDGKQARYSFLMDQIKRFRFFVEHLADVESRALVKKCYDYNYIRNALYSAIRYCESLPLYLYYS